MIILSTLKIKAVNYIKSAPRAPFVSNIIIGYFIFTVKTHNDIFLKKAVTVNNAVSIYICIESLLLKYC